MAGPQEFQEQAVDNQVADTRNIEETDASFELTDLNKSQKKYAELKMADPRTFEENDADVELEVLPQYQANDVNVERADVERADDNSVQHTWLCMGGDPAHCGCPRRPTRREFLTHVARDFGYTLLALAALLLFFYGVYLWSSHVADAEASQAQAENCTVVYSYATPMGACVNGTKLDSKLVYFCFSPCCPEISVGHRAKLQSFPMFSHFQDDFSAR